MRAEALCELAVAGVGMDERVLIEMREPAWRLAVRALRRAEGAEDVLQEAYLAAFRQLRAGVPARNERAWFLKIVANTARLHLRGEVRRRRREEAVGESTVRTREDRPGEELVAVLRRSIGELDDKYRLPVALCCEEGLTQREAAEVLEIPERNVSLFVKVGLDKLRESLARSGYAAAPAAIVGALSHTAPPVPATLAAAVTKLVSSEAVAKGVNAAVAGHACGGQASASLKGGLIVKIGLGVTAVGLVAGTAFWAVSGGAESLPAVAGRGPAAESPPVAATEKKSKFDTPVWHPEARWEKAGDWAGTGVSSNLDGPRQEVMWRSNFGNFEDPIAFDPQGGPFGLRGYDPTTDRIHFIAGSGRGCMDGPFSRARWGGQGYVDYPSRALSPDRRFQVRTDPKNGGAVRILDFKEQMIRTALPPRSGAQAMVINSKGEVLVLLGKGRLVTIDPATAKTTGEITLKATDGLNLGNGRGLALDEKRARLYASGAVVNQGGKNWHVWYFDLNDSGSFHGVLAAVERLGPNSGYAGPFDSYKGYAEQGIAFGPDDPDRRFLYMRCTDTGTFMRLDLEKRLVAACSGAPKGKTEPVLFIESGTPNGTIPHAGPIWLPGGDFIMMGLRSGPAPYFRRVK